jgi:hypothetical protein
LGALLGALLWQPARHRCRRAARSFTLTLTVSLTLSLSLALTATLALSVALALRHLRAIEAVEHPVEEQRGAWRGLGPGVAAWRLARARARGSSVAPGEG